MTTATEIRKVQATAGQHIGDIVWCDVAEVDNQGYKRADIRQLLKDEGFSTQWMPETISAAGAMGRARRDMGSPAGWRLAPRKGESRSKLYIWRQVGDGLDTVDEAAAVVSVTPEGTCSPSFNPKHDCVELQAIAAAVVKRWEWHHDYISHHDVSRMMIQTIRHELYGVPMKRNGHLYWVPSVSAQRLGKFAAFVNGLGDCQVHSVPIYDSAEARTTASSTLTASLKAEILSISHKFADLFNTDGTRVSTLEKRLDDMETVAAQIDVLQTVLGQAGEDLASLAGIQTASFQNAIVMAAVEQDEAKAKALEDKAASIRAGIKK